MKTRALVYVRKSIVKNRRDEISPERQLVNCQTAAEVHGWYVGDTDVYQDADGHRSGRTEDHRPAWQALKSRIASDPTIAAVVVNSLDRGSRSPKDFFAFLDLVQRHGVEIVSVTEQFDTSTAIGRAFLAILMVIASLESDLASERVTSTIDYLKSQGLHWGQTPYGYTRDDDAVPQPNKDSQAVVEALTQYAQGGHSYGDVANHLNAHSSNYTWRDRQGNSIPFTKHSVRSIVSNVLLYAGWLPVGRGKDMQITDKGRTLRDLVLLTDAVPGLHPPLIDEELADRVLAARHCRVAMGPRRGVHVFLLTPLLHCAICGQQLRGKADHRKSNLEYAYCHRGGVAGCIEAAGLKPGNVNGSHIAGELERRVLDLLDLQLPPDLVDDLRQSLVARIWARPDNVAIKEQIDHLEEQRLRLRDLYLVGDYDQEEYAVLRGDLRRQIEELGRQMEATDYSLDYVVARLGRLNSILHQGSRDQQKRALGLLLQRIWVDLEGNVKEVVLQYWAQPLFVDLVAMLGDQIRPQGTFNATVVATLKRHYPERFAT
jgi:site-specific DNA recombinase